MNAPQPNQTVRRGLTVITSIVLMAAMVGFFVGLRQTPEDVTSSQQWRELVQQDTEPINRAVPTAPSYEEINARMLGPNKNFHPELSALEPVELSAEDLKKITAEKVSREDVIAMLDARAQRRAYEGAPPVVPHPVHQLDTRNCMVCHEKTVRIGERISPRMSHQFLSNCTQCHVESNTRAWAFQPGLPVAVGDSQAVGLIAPLKGKRAFPEAPPTIPHRTWMRSNCTSCHSPAGSSPLRTSHPYRQSCTQCHVPDSPLDQPPALRLD